eukprot:COSAG04_NODE_23084_length_344_cov_0.836735_1_plen_33_part_01
MNALGEVLPDLDDEENVQELPGVESMKVLTKKE